MTTIIPDNFDLVAPAPIKYFQYLDLESSGNTYNGQFSKGGNGYSYCIKDFAQPAFSEDTTRNELRLLYRMVIAALTPEFAVTDLYGEIPKSVTASNLQIHQDALKTLFITNTNGGKPIRFFSKVSLQQDHFMVRPTQALYDLMRPNVKAHTMRGYDLDFDLTQPSVMCLYTFLEACEYENLNPKTAGKFTIPTLINHIPELNKASKGGTLTNTLLDTYLIKPLQSLAPLGLEHDVKWGRNIRSSKTPTITIANHKSVLIHTKWQFPTWKKSDDLLVGTNNDTCLAEPEENDQGENYVFSQPSHIKMEQLLDSLATNYR